MRLISKLSADLTQLIRTQVCGGRIIETLAMHVVICRFYISRRLIRKTRATFNGICATRYCARRDNAVRQEFITQMGASDRARRSCTVNLGDLELNGRSGDSCRGKKQMG